jgi:cytidine deaminase
LRKKASEREAVRRLVGAATLARKAARAPYSRFRVGAALGDGKGGIVTGCNVENASYGLTLCAERVAAFKAVSEGRSGFTTIAVVTAARTLTTPCGACRQVLWELFGDILVHVENLKGESLERRLSVLFPLPFDSSSL